MWAYNIIPEIWIWHHSKSSLYLNMVINIHIHVSGYISLMWFDKHWKTGTHCPTLELVPMLNIWLGLELTWREWDTLSLRKRYGVGFPKLGKGRSDWFSEANHLRLFSGPVGTEEQPKVVCWGKSQIATLPKLRKIHFPSKVLGKE